MPNWKKLIVSGSSAELTTLKLTGLSAGTPTTALMLDGSGNVEKRTLGSNAFNSTSFATGDNFDADGTFTSLRAQGTTKGDVGLGNVENTALSTYTGNGGALDNQYITNGANYVTAAVTLTTAAQTNITSLGTLTSLTVDDITLNGSTISDSGDLTLDIGGDLNIDVDGADIVLKDGGTTFGRFKRDTSDFIIKSETSDKDMIFRGNDGGVSIDALTLDMSGGGYATFNAGLNAGGDISGVTRLTVDDIDINGSTISDSGDFTLDVGGDISIDADGGDIILKDGGTIVGTFSMNQNSGDFDVRSRVSNKDLVFKGNDGGVEITALTLDMSAGGTALFKDDVVAYASSDERYKNFITPIENPNEKIKLLSGNTFVWNDKHEVFKGKKDIGVIAQEVEKVLPEIVETRDNGYKAVKYEKIVALLIESNKELLKRVEELEKKL